MPPIRALILVALLPLAAACGGRPWRQTLAYARSPIAIYQEEKFLEKAVVPQGFAHPVRISPADLRGLLAGIRYNPKGFMGFGRKTDQEPLFTEAETEGLAVPLSQSLEKSGPDQRVRFLVARTNWSVASAKGISAVVFLDAPDHLNIAFDLLVENLPDGGGDPKALLFFTDPVEITGTSPAIGPPLGAQLRISASGGLHPRWLTVDTKLLPLLAAPAPQASAAPAPTPPAGTPPAAPPESPAEAILRKLNNLEQLKEKGVISAEEYEKLRWEILLQRD